MQITWKQPPRATALHAALAVAEGVSLADPRLGETLRCVLPTLADAPDEQRRQLRQHAGQAVSGAAPPARVGAVADVYDEWRNETGGGPVADELAHRERPIREQWEARGEGLLGALQRLTEPGGLVPRATVALVLPAAGGHGVALPDDRVVLLEAVLANPVATVPEVLRLGWLLAQLGDAPAPPLALAPAVLAAAEEVELAAADEENLAAALAAWRVADRPADGLAARLWRWWRDYRAMPVPWRVAAASAPSA